MRIDFRFILLCIVILCAHSCSNEDIIGLGDDSELFSGIEYTTNRNQVNNYSGVGIACELANFLPGSSSEHIIYGVFAGDSINFDNIMLSEEAAFQLFWIDQNDNGEGSSFPSFGLQFRSFEQDNGDISVAEDLEVEMTDITEERMIGRFSANFVSRSGEKEEITGRFNVERQPCEP